MPTSHPGVGHERPTTSATEPYFNDLLAQEVLKRDRVRFREAAFLRLLPRVPLERRFSTGEELELASRTAKRIADYATNLIYPELK